MTTREEAIRAANPVYAAARAHRDSLSPHDAAVEAWYPGHRLGTVEAIEEQIIRRRREAAEAWAAGTHPLQFRQQLPAAA